MNLRFTDFLVFEIDQNDRVLHLKSLEPPEPSSVPNASNSVPPQEGTSTPQAPATASLDPPPVPEGTEDTPVLISAQEGRVWSEDCTVVLQKFLSPLEINNLKQMYEEGPEPPFISDSGWGSRREKQEEGFEIPEETAVETTSKRGRGRGRGGRGGNRGSRAWKKEDTRRVVTEVCTFPLRIHLTEKDTQPIEDKAVRTELHKAIRQLFKGNLDSETDTTSTTSANDEDGSRIFIKWVSGGSRRGKNAGKSMSPSPAFAGRGHRNS